MLNSSSGSELSDMSAEMSEDAAEIVGEGGRLDTLRKTSLAGDDVMVAASDSKQRALTRIDTLGP